MSIHHSNSTALLGTNTVWPSTQVTWHDTGTHFSPCGQPCGISLIKEKRETKGRKEDKGSREEEEERKKGRQRSREEEGRGKEGRKTEER